MRKSLIALLFLFLLLPNISKAEEITDFDTIYQQTKYFKTIINKNNRITSSTEEISKKEYDDYNTISNPKASVETVYKKITSTITANGNYYRYTANLHWKNIPSTRSYDILGIGFYSSVKVKNNNVYFSQNYCITGGSCYTTSTHSPQVFTTGAGTTFLLPSGNLSSLDEVMYFDVAKNTNLTIINQMAAADHSHAIQSISLTNAKKYTVSGSAGIVLNSSITSYYDAISPAIQYWSGSW